ncbi:ADP-ribose pyrophosphatase YjhB, NUDIX family [Nocardioides sp. YR527]|uniref:NUDIX hydrolase n=1 Tax=Nocardioides sp. YR527 TaxID=1881028 RepID=UPI00088F0C22|nr:NUDIX domain-containing protein [Nocardioides sp. YR527]SDL23926.1 ADP-ribose pyrophosphatase YjhB, NUDIX family [Nocardioides sp. YR527]
MPTPDFILDLRRKIGTDMLWLPGVTAVVRRDDEILLVQRSDNRMWTPITGIVDPGEQPATAAAREAKEETGVDISVDRLASVGATTPMAYPNGDQAVYMDHTFSCTWVSGEAYVADDESMDVGWFRVEDLPEMHHELRARIDAALSGEIAARFTAP